ncbi:MAG: DotU family type IV/VI secretion system protein [Gammaproteobacteria bacterium]|nr:DotU family type IV/VI secretion system protein [Gammaproteobacteria bacterium]
MSSDESDKTVFRQSGTKKESTVIRPMPGRRGSSSATQVPAGAQGQSKPAPAQYRSADNYAGPFKTQEGLNPLVNAASMLMAVLCKVQQSVSHPNVAGLHQQLVNEIRKFESVAKEQGCRHEIVISARYILCTVLDEAVLNTPWGAESAWPQRTLLSIYHNETHGGEKFFQILDKMRERPGENIDILELMYLCLSVGFEGKYRVVQRGREKIELVRDEVFRLIRTHRGSYERSLSPSGQGLGRIRNTLTHYVPLWVIASVIAGVLILGYSGFRYVLYKSSTEIVKQLDEVTQAEVKTHKNPANSN